MVNSNQKEKDSEKELEVESPLYESYGSIEEFFNYAYTQLPINKKNTLYGLLMAFKNTLLKEPRK